MTKLTKNHVSALEELERHEHRAFGGPFWWRIASMKQLAEMGLVEGYLPAASRSTAYRLTDAGRQALASQPVQHSAGEAS